MIETFQEDFLSPVIDPASTWSFVGDFARSGTGDTSTKLFFFFLFCFTDLYDTNDLIILVTNKPS